MTHLPLVYYPDQRLKTVCSSVTQVDEAVQQLIEDMIETMYAEEGCGLAAPQIGSLLRIFVGDDFKEEGKKNPFVMINPEIIWHDEAEHTRAEGCLSIPDAFVEMTRPQAVKVKYLNRDGQETEEMITEFKARIIQHENDHLNGVLMIDHLSQLKKNMIKAKVKKIIKMQKHGE